MTTWKADGGCLHDDVTCYTATVIKTQGYWQRDTHRSMRQRGEPRRSTLIWPTNF
jgi:hypothetical protein